MADDNPMSVFVAENQQVADAVVNILVGAGIAAEVHVPPIDSSSEPLTGASELVWGRAQFDVRVTNPAQLAAAKELLDSAIASAAVRAAKEKRAARTGTVTAVCEECGKPSEWPASVMGTTDTCPHCSRFMDIPDPDEDWSGMDFGETEEGAEESKE